MSIAVRHFFLREKNSKIGSQIKITFTPISVLFLTQKFLLAVIKAKGIYMY